MSAANPTPDELDDAACQRALAVLVDIGTALAHELKTPDPAPGAPNVAARAAAFERVALAVRRTILLSQHIAAGTAARAAVPAERAHRRKEIIRAVEAKIVQHADPEDVLALRVELLERLDAPDFDVDLAHLKPVEHINRLCDDLGAVARTYGGSKPLRRTPEDIRRLCQRAARSGEPEPDPFSMPSLPQAGEGRGEARRPTPPH